MRWRILFLMVASLLVTRAAVAADGDMVSQGYTGSYKCAILCDGKTSDGNCAEFDLFDKFGANWSQLSFSVENDTTCGGTETATISARKVSGGKAHQLGVLTSTTGEGDSFTDYKSFRYILSSVANVGSCSPGYTVWVCGR